MVVLALIPQRSPCLIAIIDLVKIQSALLNNYETALALTKELSAFFCLYASGLIKDGGFLS